MPEQINPNGDVSPQGTVFEARAVCLKSAPDRAHVARKREDLEMYSVTKWMLVAALIGVNGDAIARAQANDLDSVADLRTNGITSPEGAFQERDGRFLHEEGLSGTPG